MPTLEQIAREFIDYYTGENPARIARVGADAASGCGNCGAVPHSTTCFVKRFSDALVGSHGNQSVSEASGLAQSASAKKNSDDPS